MIRLFAAVLLLLVVPIALKERAGDLRELATQNWKEGVANRYVLAPMEAVGLPVEAEADGSFGTANAPACHIDLRATDPQAQTLGYLKELSRDFHRLPFLYKGKVYGEFPYLNALTQHVLFVLLNSVGIENDYQPAIALFEKGACSGLDRFARDLNLSSGLVLGRPAAAQARFSRMPKPNRKVSAAPAAAVP